MLCSAPRLGYFSRIEIFIGVIAAKLFILILLVFSDNAINKSQQYTGLKTINSCFNKFKLNVQSLLQIGRQFDCRVKSFLQLVFYVILLLLPFTTE